MIRNQMTYEIPTANNCLLAVHQDIEKNLETIVLGSMDNVQEYLRGNSNSGIFAEAKRPLGSFPADCFQPLTEDMALLRINLLNGINPKKRKSLQDAQNYLASLYQSDNFAYKFLAIRLWEEYKKTASIYVKHKVHKEDNTLMDDFRDKIENLTLPFRYSIKRDILTWQCNHPRYPLHYFDNEYYKFPGGLLWAGDTKTSEYGFCTVSLMPLLMYSLKQLYANKLYFQHCKLCKKLFLTKTANMPSFCGLECKREQGRLNKRKHDEQARELYYEKLYKSTYMVWHRGVQWIKENASDPKQVKVAEQAMKEFREEAVRRKAEVKAGKMDEKGFTNWLQKQCNVIYEIKESVVFH